MNPDPYWYRVALIATGVAVVVLAVGLTYVIGVS